jgi:hypothetical protein
MKRLPVLLLVNFVWGAASAQDPASTLHSRKDDAVYKEALTSYSERKNNESDTTVVGPAKPYYLVNPKPGIHRLPQDNMPCIVPDGNATVSIPNAWKGGTTIPFRGTAPRIPNQSKRLKIAPSRPLLIRPDTDTKSK